MSHSTPWIPTQRSPGVRLIAMNSNKGRSAPHIVVKGPFALIYEESVSILESATTTVPTRYQERAGAYVPQTPGRYKAFIPRSLPPAPPLSLSPDIQVLLSEADRAIGRLDATTELLPNPDLFVMMYVRKEAVDSSRIEGTQASLTDLLEYEARPVRGPSQAQRCASGRAESKQLCNGHELWAGATLTAPALHTVDS